MHRWVARFGTIWLILFVPSLAGWGLVVRWNATGIDKFQRTWSWLADLLGFPLIVNTVTDRSWLWLNGDSALRATSGFAILLVMWCLMIALPASLVLSWADWLGRKIGPSTSSSISSYEPYSSSPSSSAALNALYLITVPLALSWHLLRWLGRTLRPAVITFVIVWLCVFVGYVIALHRTTVYGWPRHLQELNDAWNGYLGTLGFHRLFADAWENNFSQSVTLAQRVNRAPYLWQDVVDNTSHYPYVLKVFALFAAMHALIVAVAVGAVAGLFRQSKA